MPARPTVTATTSDAIPMDAYRDTYAETYTTETWGRGRSSSQAPRAGATAYRPPTPGSDAT